MKCFWMVQWNEPGHSGLMSRPSASAYSSIEK